MYSQCRPAPSQRQGPKKARLAPSQQTEAEPEVEIIQDSDEIIEDSEVEPGGPGKPDGKPNDPPPASQSVYEKWSCRFGEKCKGYQCHVCIARWLALKREHRELQRMARERRAAERSEGATTPDPEEQHHDAEERRSPQHHSQGHGKRKHFLRKQAK